MNWLFYKQLLTCFTGAHDSRGCQGSDAKTVHHNGGGPGYHQGKVRVPLDMHPESPVCPQWKVPQMHLCRAMPSMDSCIDTFLKCVRLSHITLLYPYYCPLICLLCLSLKNVCETYLVTCFQRKIWIIPKAQLHRCLVGFDVNRISFYVFYTCWNGF